MKFKLVFSILILLILATFSYAIYISIKLERTNSKLNDIIQKYEDAGLKIEYLENENSKALIDYAKLINEGTQNKWEIASGTNTLAAYSMFVENCNGEVEDCHNEDLENAINSLLNSDGYVEFVETNGNKLYTEVNLALDGKYVKFNKDKSVRNGAIGINDCGSSYPSKTGIVLKGKIVKILNECHASGSQSVWAHIQYTN
jgi:hypothetical protein